MKQSDFQFYIEHPQTPLASWQAVWSCSLHEAAATDTRQTLYSDAGSGITFNFGQPLLFNDVVLVAGVYADPVIQHAETVTIPRGADFCGIRFLPNVGYDVIGRPERISPLSPSLGSYQYLQQLYQQLSLLAGHAERMQCLRQAVASPPLGDWLQQAAVNQFDVMETKPLSERQKQRVLQTRMGLGPKRLQRILRVKQAVEALKQNPNIDLCELAYQFEFSDQSHMTREFKAIAKDTPQHIQHMFADKLLQKTRAS